MGRDRSESRPGCGNGRLSGNGIGFGRFLDQVHPGGILKMLKRHPFVIESEIDIQRFRDRRGALIGILRLDRCDWSGPRPGRRDR